MRRLTWFAVVAIGFGVLAGSLGQPAGAQEAGAQAESANPGEVSAAIEQRYRLMTEALQEKLPERDFSIVTLPPAEVSVRGADLKIMENKFRAQLVFSPAIADPEVRKSLTGTPSEVSHSDIESMQQRPPALLQLLHFQDRFVLHPSLSSASYPDDQSARVSIGEHLQRLAASSPAETRPAEESLAFLTSADADRDVRFSSKSIGRLTQNPLTIYAPSAEAAEQRARAIVQLYDGGFSRPLQAYFLAAGEKVLELIAAATDEVNMREAKIQAEQASLSKPSDISPEVLGQLKAQKVLVAVELAGLSARIKACDARLSDPKKLDAGTLQSIGAIKVTAEIERVGVQEKLDQIQAYIAEGETRREAHVRLVELQDQRNRLQRRIKSLQRDALKYADLFALYAPFEVVDNQISVGPIEWTTE